jgi:sec-independent protein translocase protein TatA
MELFTPGHLIPLLVIVAILFFGWKQLPDMSRSLGRSLRIFKTEIKGMGQDDKQRAEAEPTAPKALQPPPAQFVKPATNSAAAPRPRPTPRPTAQSTPGGGGADTRRTGA